MFSGAPQRFTQKFVADVTARAADFEQMRFGFRNQAGALQAMTDAGVRPDLLVGTSIGAFNALGCWLDELVGRAPSAPAPATRLGGLWRRLSHRGQGSRLLLDKPWLLGWITGRPDWNRRLAGDLAHQLSHAGATWAALQHGLFTTNRLEMLTRRIVADALGLPRRASAEHVGMALLDAAKIERETNELIARAVVTETVWITDEELDARPELVKTMSVQPPRGAGRVRLLKISGIDLQPCGGTHVANIGEIGAIRVLKIRSEGKHNKRVEIALA